MQTAVSAPQGAKVLPLAEGSKVPRAGGRGHLDAVPTVDLSLQPGENYGIALDGAFLVVDFDRPDQDHFADKLPATWTQKTRRGTHMLYRIPEGFKGKNARFSAGDIKVRGYIVGPGSEVQGSKYELVSPVDPVQAPQWLLDTVRSSENLDAPAGTNPDILGLDAVPDGERNNSLTRLGGLMRRLGLGEGAIATGLSALNEKVVDPPLALSEIRHIAKMVARYESVPGELGPLAPDGWITAADVSFVGPPTRWWVRGYVPKNELVMLYGKGGKGKSTWGSWLACEVTQRGGRFAFAGVEEPFVRFAARAVLGNAVPELLLKVPRASELTLPKDAPKLAEVLGITGVDVLYFDSIYAHFETVPGQNAAERARRCLSPLAEIAQEMGKTIVCVFHENKMGQLLGSLEMENVARVSLHASREDGKPLFISVDKTNLKRPEYHMTFEGQEMALSDPETGEVQMEEQDDGTLAPETVFVAKRGPDVARDTISLADIEEPQIEVQNYFEVNPEASLRRAAADLGISKSHVHRLKAAVPTLN